MFNQIYLGLPLWVWIIVIAIVTFSVYQTTCNKTTCNKNVAKPETTREIKEKFADTQIPQNLQNKPIVKIFNFNTTWCGWSVKFQPEWDDFAKYVAVPSNVLSHVKAYDIKGDDEFKNKVTGDLQKTNGELEKAYEVPGYPYIIIEVNGSRISYKGDRTKDALVSFIKTI